MGKWYLLYLACMISLLIAGCSAMLPVLTSAIGGASKDGISAELQIGDKEIGSNIGGMQGTGKIEVKNGNVTATTSKITSKIDKAKDVTINEGPSPFFILLLLVGWVLPSPREIFLYFRYRKAPKPRV